MAQNNSAAQPTSSESTAWAAQSTIMSGRRESVMNVLGRYYTTETAGFSTKANDPPQGNAEKGLTGVLIPVPVDITTCIASNRYRSTSRREQVQAEMNSAASARADGDAASARQGPATIKHGHDPDLLAILGDVRANEPALLNVLEAVVKTPIPIPSVRTEVAPFICSHTLLL